MSIFDKNAEKIAQKRIEQAQKAERVPHNSAAESIPSEPSEEKSKVDYSKESLVLVGIRMTKSERSKLKALAAAKGTTIQNFVRSWLQNL